MNIMVKENMRKTREGLDRSPLWRLGSQSLLKGNRHGKKIPFSRIQATRGQNNLKEVRSGKTQ